MPQYATSVRNARLDAIETAIGTTPTLEVFTGTAPALTTDADTGTKLWSEPLPSDWANAASGGTKTLLGTWQANAIATGTPGHYRLKSSGGTVMMQGTSGVGSGELQFDGTFTNGQQATVTAFTITEGNA